MLTRFFDLAVIRRKLKFNSGATIDVVQTDGTTTTLSIAELAALNDLGATDLAKIDGITNGTAAAGKAVVLDSSSAIDLVKFGAIGASDSSLGVDGQAAAQGGAIVVTGGASSTATNAGGAVTLKGGAGNTSGAGGANNILGGVGGATGIGGQVNVTGGVPTDAAGGAVVIAGAAGVGTNRAGGLASVTGGASTGSATGGVASLVGGAAGAATGTGGASQVTGGVGNTSGAGGAVTVEAGAGGTTGAGGNAAMTGGRGGSTSGAAGTAIVTAGAGGATPSTVTGGVARLIAGAGGAGATGNGGNAEVTGGASLATDGNGGAVIVTGGALSGTGVQGGVHLRSKAAAGAGDNLVFTQQSAATTAIADGNWAPTVAQFINGILSGDVTTGRTLTTPTGAQLSTACGIGLAVGDAFNVYVSLIGSAGADDILTMTAGDGNVTFIGTLTIGPIVAGTSPGAATWRFRNTGTNTWVGYRIA